MAKKKQPQEEPTVRRQRRSVDQQIADMVAKIAALKGRETRKQAKADPALKQALAAFRSTEKALAATSDARVRHNLLAARAALAPILGRPGGGSAVENGHSEIDVDSLLTDVRNNSGQRGEQIAEAMATDAGRIRPVMKRLSADGKVRTQGQKRGMTYEAVETLRAQ